MSTTELLQRRIQELERQLDAARLEILCHSHLSDEERERAQAAEGERDRCKAERDELISQIKQHRQATESRLRMLNGREAIDTMLKPDRDLYDLLDRLTDKGRELLVGGEGR